MKRYIFITLISCFVFITESYAGISVCGDATKVTSFSLRGNPVQGCEYYDHGQNITGTEYDQIKTLLKTVPIQHLKMSNGVPVEMSEAEKTAVNDAMAAANVTEIRTQAKNQLEGFGGTTLYQRAFADITKDEINLLRDWITQFKAQVALASNLADLKTRVAALPAMPDRTLTQLKTAIQNRVDSGQADN